MCRCRDLRRRLRAKSWSTGSNALLDSSVSRPVPDEETEEAGAAASLRTRRILCARRRVGLPARLPSSAGRAVARPIEGACSSPRRTRPPYRSFVAGSSTAGRRERAERRSVGLAHAEKRDSDERKCSRPHRRIRRTRCPGRGEPLRPVSASALFTMRPERSRRAAPECRIIRPRAWGSRRTIDDELAVRPAATRDRYKRDANPDAPWRRRTGLVAYRRCREPGAAALCVHVPFGFHATDVGGPRGRRGERALQQHK